MFWFILFFKRANQEHYKNDEKKVSVVINVLNYFIFKNPFKKGLQPEIWSWEKRITDMIFGHLKKKLDLFLAEGLTKTIVFKV